MICDDMLKTKSLVNNLLKIIFIVYIFSYNFPMIKMNLDIESKFQIQENFVRQIRVDISTFKATQKRRVIRVFVRSML